MTLGGVPHICGKPQRTTDKKKDTKSRSLITQFVRGTFSSADSVKKGVSLIIDVIRAPLEEYEENKRASSHRNDKGAKNHKARHNNITETYILYARRKITRKYRENNKLYI